IISTYQPRLEHIDLVPTNVAIAPVARLDLEPLSASFTLTRWNAILHGRRGTNKSLLLRQDLIAGIGNIYADEILWQARLHPARLAHLLRDGELARLYQIVP